MNRLDFYRSRVRQSPRKISVNIIHGGAVQYMGIYLYILQTDLHIIQSSDIQDCQVKSAPGARDWSLHLHSGARILDRSPISTLLTTELRTVLRASSQLNL